jgi:hypothetical protein
VVSPNSSAQEILASYALSWWWLPCLTVDFMTSPYLQRVTAYMVCYCLDFVWLSWKEFILILS